VKEKKMKRNQLLFVTYHDENFEDGLSYALDLAKTMNDGIEILMIYKRKVLEKFDDMMIAITFAEAGEQQTAREMISEDYKKKNEDYEKKLATIKEKCTKSGIAVDFSTAAMDAISAIKNILRQNAKIDMVLLSPSVTNDGNVNAKVLNKLVKTASRPVVTMAKQASVA
jgi:L-lactate utilization protein LutB